MKTDDHPDDPLAFLLEASVSSTEAPADSEKAHGGFDDPQSILDFMRSKLRAAGDEWLTAGNKLKVGSSLPDGRTMVRRLVTKPKPPAAAKVSEPPAKPKRVLTEAQQAELQKLRARRK